MSVPQEPTRLLEAASDLDPGAREVLRLAGDTEPSADDMARLDARLAALLVADAGAGASAGVSSSGKAGWQLALQWLGGSAVVGAGIVAAFFALGDRGSDQPVLSRPTQTIAPSALGLRVAAPTPTPTAPASAATESPTSPGASARPATPPTASAARPKPVSREQEVALLSQAQAALGRGDARRALELTREHQRLPGTLLVQERERIAIEALVRSGQRGAARARADAFRRAFPRSSYLSRIDSLLQGPAR